MRKSPNRPIKKFSDNLPEINISTLHTPETVIQYCFDRGLLIDRSTIDVEKLIENIPNITLDKKNLGDLDAKIENVNADEYCITVNSKHSKSRQRFSMAHELAHFLLHRDKMKDFSEGEKILHRSKESNFIETQANRFASELLMPEDFFRRAVLAHSGSIEHIAAIFDVSQIAVRYRAKNLGMQGHGV